MTNKPCSSCHGTGIVYSDPDHKQLVCGDCDGEGNAMTAPLSAESARPNIVVSDERVEKLKAQVQSEVNVSKDIAEYRRWADLLAILDSYSSMRADWDKIPEIRADKIRYKIRAEKAEAQLAKQAPLVEAAMTIDELDIQMGLALGMPAAIGATAFAALKYREEQGK
jgi:hypothetical protein